MRQNDERVTKKTSSPPTAEERAERLYDVLSEKLLNATIVPMTESEWRPVAIADIAAAIRDAEAEAVQLWREWFQQAGPFLESYFETWDYSARDAEALEKLLDFWRAHASHIT